MILWLVFLCAASCVDWKKQEIPVWIYGVFALVGAVRIALRMALLVNAGESMVPVMTGLAASAAVGILLLLVSVCSDGAVGDGDGWFFLVSGLYLTWLENLSLLCFGLFLCSLYGIGLTLHGVWKRVSVRNRKIPFLPFLLPMGIWMVFL